MVLNKVMITFVLFFLGSISFAMATEKKKRFTLREALYAKTNKEFNERISALKKPLSGYSEKKRESFILLLEKKKEFRAAKRFFLAFIKESYVKEFRYYLRTIKGQKNKKDKTSQYTYSGPFLFLLYRDALTSFKKYKHDYNTLSEALKSSFRSNLTQKIKFLLEQDFEEEDLLDELEDQLKEFEALRQQEVFHINYILQLGQSMYKRKLNLLRESDGASNTIIASERMLNIGLGPQIENHFLTYQLRLHILTGSASVQNDSTAQVNYFQAGVKSSGFGLVPGVLWKIHGGVTSFGLEVPILYLKGQYSTPANFSFEKTSDVSIGLTLLGRWMLFKSIGVETSFGKMSGMKSAFWHMGGLFIF